MPDEKEISAEEIVLANRLRVILPPLAEGYHYEIVNIKSAGYAVIVEKDRSEELERAYVSAVEELTDYASKMTDAPCEYTFSHTREICGNSNCREF